jgi:hypothetical protein
MVVLIPARSRTAIGAELLLIGVVVWAVLLAILVRSTPHVRSLREQGMGPPSRLVAVVSVVSRQLVTLPTILAGATLLAHTGGGLYWLAAGTGLALVVGVADAWVLLIEIQR